MVKDHSDSERGNPLPSHGLFFPINSKVFFYMHHPTDRIAHTTAFVTPVVEHWLEREIAQLVHPMKDRSDDHLHHERTLLPPIGAPIYIWPRAAILPVPPLACSATASVQVDLVLIRLEVSQAD